MVLIGDNNSLQTMLKTQNPHDLEIVMTEKAGACDSFFSHLLSRPHLHFKKLKELNCRCGFASLTLALPETTSLGK